MLIMSNHFGLFILFNYINDLTKDISSTNKLLIAIFFIVHDTNVSKYELNSDLKKVSMWACWWKMSFNPHIS